ncbi:MAG: serine/threonine protein kinase [Planctomycetaceae bacterium]|nr:serine/threonine protein kinase [Planctomycetaceae bacterium]
MTNLPHAGSETPVCPMCLLGLGLPQVAATQDWRPPGQEGPDFGMDESWDRVPDVAQLVNYFPNLEIQHLIGYGGMGAVYQARQPHLDRIVALKILSPRLSRNPAFAQRFMREARTLAKLAHPNIVMVFEFGQAGPLHYLILEYVDGVNLRDAMLEGHLSTKEALAIVPQLCDALQYAHDEGIVHRDIKPENILLDKKGRVKIADFGLAKLIQPNTEDMRLTGSKQVLGTLNYMAPEQIEGRSNIDHRADIYSMGVVLYELLTGELPLGRFAVPSEKNNVDVRLDDVVLRTLEKEPQRRYQNASDVKTAMQEISVVEAMPSNLAAAVMPQPLGPPPSIPAPTPMAKPLASNMPPTVPQTAPRSMPAAGFNQAIGQTVGSASPRAQSGLVAVPFTIENVNWGFAVCSGIAKTTADGLSIEFEVRDSMFQSTWKKPTTMLLPWDQIASANYAEGLLSDTLVVQATMIAATAEIPDARGGSFSVKIKKIHRTEGKELIAAIKRQLAAHPSHTQHVWGKSSVEPEWLVALRRSTDYAIQHFPLFWSRKPINPLQVAARFSSVQFWFVTCGVLNFVLLSSSFRKMFRETIRPMVDAPESSAVYPLAQWLLSFDSVINPFSTHFGNGYFPYTVAFSIALFVAADKLKYAKSYESIAVVCGLALIPFYPTYLIAAPIALLGLIAMLLPSTIATFDLVEGDGHVAVPELQGKQGQLLVQDLWLARPWICVRRVLLVIGLVAAAGLVLFVLVPTAIQKTREKVEQQASVTVRATDTDLPTAEAAKVDDPTDSSTEASSSDQKEPVKSEGKSESDAKETKADDPAE